ncbi:MAG: GNAT family N-acetyltransferase [Candidatus Eremiobacteraeota bacterium]|nr:GNAT family N-acetyltransferase [Candidatus Eremiobacteraeota bacterium]
MDERITDEPITTLKEFESQREAWERLYRADPDGQVFVSWPWLAAYLSTAKPGWLILTRRNAGDLIAALPLRISPIPSRFLPAARQLSFASAPVADFQGMLCAPGRERNAVVAFAAAIERMGWDRIAFTDVCDPRVRELLAALGQSARSIETTGTTVCPRVDLPATWEQYTKSLGQGTRATTVRSIRRLHDDLPAFRISSPNDDDIDAHVEAMVKLHHLRWGGNLRRSRLKYGALHRAAYHRGCLRLIVLWDAQRPIAAAASFVDPVRSTYNLYQLAFDAGYAKYSPGKGAVGLAIRDAIDGGFKVFDFLRGDEKYKAAYAAGRVQTTHHRIVRGGIRSALFSAIQPAYVTVKAAAVRVVYGPGRSFSR